jgi:hypothetical protein
MTSVPQRTRLYLLIGVIWFLVAVVVGASGVLTRMGPTVPQLWLVALTVLLIAAGALIASFRSWLTVVDLRLPIAVHLSRFVGIYFLMLYARGLLPFDFAALGGWGDIAVAVTALAFIVVTRDPMVHRGLLWIWNIFGFFDIVFVVLTAARMAAADPPSMGLLRVLPLSLLPTFFVPLIIASHVLIFWRLGRVRLREA